MCFLLWLSPHGAGPRRLHCFLLGWLWRGTPLHKKWAAPPPWVPPRACWVQRRSVGQTETTILRTSSPGQRVVGKTGPKGRTFGVWSLRAAKILRGTSLARTPFMSPGKRLPSTALKQFPVWVEDFPQNNARLAQTAVHSLSVGAHCLCYGIWIENWPSSTLAFPVVRVAGCRECMLLKGIIGAKGGNALKGCTNSIGQMWEIDDLFEQFFGNHLLLDRVQRCMPVAGEALPQVVKGPNPQNIDDRAYREVLFPREVPQCTIRQRAKQVAAKAIFAGVAN